MKGKPYITGGQAYGPTMIVVNIKEPSSLAGPRLFLEREQRTSPKLTELTRKGRIKRRRKSNRRTK